VEVLPDLGEEVKEGQEEGVEGVEPAVEAAWGGDVGEEVQVFGEGQGFVVLATEFHGGEYGEGKDERWRVFWPGGRPCSPLPGGRRL
jgi:hypothetical protein